MLVPVMEWLDSSSTGFLQRSVVALVAEWDFGFDWLVVEVFGVGVGGGGHIVVVVILSSDLAHQLGDGGSVVVMLPDLASWWWRQLTVGGEGL
ncbi:Hypothetical predicted protein [Olea europaea subsp. europaea]|uniref:Uncharacterized protein n=1 Tax=Olea europaea subsp. europaea TaxID=158383 RepID=A0A8S0S0C0_OLEEU|nr:Hypothetical predicted protein [Olea europaea subsp. europaea]